MATQRMFHAFTDHRVIVHVAKLLNFLLLRPDAHSSLPRGADRRPPTIGRRTYCSSTVRSSDRPTLPDKPRRGGWGTRPLPTGPGSNRLRAWGMQLVVGARHPEASSGQVPCPYVKVGEKVGGARCGRCIPTRGGAAGRAADSENGLAAAN